MARPRRVRLSTGHEVPLDGDILAIVEALYKEITLGTALRASYQTMRSEIVSLVKQMNANERLEYLAESLFLNSINYENEMLAAYVRKLTAPNPAPARRRAPARKAGVKKAR